MPHKSNRTKAPRDPQGASETQLTVIQPSESQDKLATFQQLQSASPRDQNGFLQHIYDHNLIPPTFNHHPQNKQTRILKAASLPLSMLEGYHSFEHPIHHTPTPIWNQFPHEPDTLYSAFQAFLKSPARDFQQATNHLQHQSEFHLKEVYTYYYWSDRARSYDILKPIAAAKLRDQRIFQMEDYHYKVTNKVLLQLTGEIQARADETKDDEYPEGRPWMGLKASELVSALNTMAQLQRTSLQQPSHGPNPKAHTLNNNIGTDRAIRETAQAYSGMAEGTLSPAQQMRQRIDKALAENPEAAAALQAAAFGILESVHQHKTAPTTTQTDNQGNPEDA